ncbi:MAG: class I SAM-dependent methyltransferase [Symploca sp. SIO1B1]|nr:class I SAM-dependent methyltransferase [Symploca sp. SIO1B1]
MNKLTTENFEVSTQAIKPDYQGTSTEAIQYHYDDGNDFFQLWLDNTMAYTCALWEPGEGYEALETAQIRKLDFHINQAKAKGAKRVLDIGCGWGPLLKRLVEVHGVEKAVGLTLSKAQAELVQSWKNPKIESYWENWADHDPEEPYDAILAIEVLEHVAQVGLSETEKVKAYRHFFERCHQWLKPGSCLSLQTIVYENMRPENFNEFLTTEVFPESDHANLAELVKASQRLFEIVTIRNDRLDYELTCKAWLARLKANRTAAVNLVGSEVVARYEKYLKFCIIGFHTGNINLARIMMRRLDKPCK